MVPIHDTDVAAERWVQSEWQNYELWEKVEHRFKRKRRLWILATVIVFLGLSAIPIVMERWPKWMTRSISRNLVQEINRMKLEAGVNRAAYRFRFTTEGTLDFVVERLPQCSATQAEVVRSGSFAKLSSNEAYSWISPLRGAELGIPGLVKEFCYDYLTGSAAATQGDKVIGFGIVSANDLAEKRLDRLTVLLLSGPSAESAFD
jgi:hypothetical protein